MLVSKTIAYKPIDRCRYNDKFHSLIKNCRYYLAIAEYIEFLLDQWNWRPQEDVTSKRAIAPKRAKLEVKALVAYRRSATSKSRTRVMISRRRWAFRRLPEAHDKSANRYEASPQPVSSACHLDLLYERHFAGRPHGVTSPHNHLVLKREWPAL